MYNDSLTIVLDNIKILRNINRISSYYELSQKTNIPTSTISSWYTRYRQKPIYPRLKTLDKLCDAFSVHTSDLFIPESAFKHEYHTPNNSIERFRVNFKSICINQGYVSIPDQIELFCIDQYDINISTAKERYYSYFREVNGRCIPIDQLDTLANRLDIKTHQLIE